MRSARAIIPMYADISASGEPPRCLGYLECALSPTLRERLSSLAQYIKERAFHQPSNKEFTHSLPHSFEFYSLVDRAKLTQRDQESIFLEVLSSRSFRPGIFSAHFSQLLSLPGNPLNTGLGMSAHLDTMHGQPLYRLFPSGDFDDPVYTPPMSPAFRAGIHLGLLDTPDQARWVLRELAQDYPREALLLLENGLPHIKGDGTVVDKTHGVKERAVEVLLQHESGKVRQRAFRVLHQHSPRPPRKP